MYIRYELYIDDEYQDVGILQGMDDAEFSEDLASALTFHMDKELTIPPTVFAEHRYTESWFTEEGARKFETDIQAIIYEYEYDGLFEVRKRTIDHLDNIIYEDENQVIIDIKERHREIYQREKEDLELE